MKIGDTIRLLRKAKKMTLQELSNKSGVALASISRMETGRMSGTIESHNDIARVLGVTLSYLYRVTDTNSVDCWRCGDPIMLKDEPAQENKIIVKNRLIAIEGPVCADCLNEITGFIKGEE